MATEMRKTGIGVVGDMPWGTHFCHFYETKEDLLDTLLSFFKAGLESQESCLWVVSEPLTEEEARHALKQAVPDLDRYLADRSIEIVLASDWYLQGGTFDLKRVTSGWHEKLARALARGYAGVRVTGNTAWLEKKDWKDFCEYEEALNASITNQRLTVLCTYPLAASGAAEILDVARTHQFALAKRHGNWEVVETPGLKQAKEEIKRLNEGLEQRVVERTRQLATVNEELRKEITARKRAEEELRKSERQFHALFDEAAVGMGLVNAAGHLFESNRTLQQMLGYSEEELRDLPFMQLTHPDDVELDWRLFTELISGQRDDYHIEKRYYGKDGRLVWGNLTVSLVRDERGEPLFGIGVVEDITERKRAEEALRHTQAALAHLSRVMTMGALTASVAHEVNQPLAAVVTNGNACLRWLAREVPDLEEARAAVERIIRDGHRAGEVIRRIRALTQKTEPHTAWLDLNEVIHEVVALMHSEVRKQRVALWTDLSSTLPPVLGDRIQLQQVILNLLLNGIEAMQAVTDRVRELRIRSYRHASDEVGVAVQDSGIGLDPQRMARLFDAFFTTKPGGMGIGLAISRTIIEAHGGRLWATPHDGPGATFQFSLPAGSEGVS